MYDPEAQHRQLALDLLRRHDGLERIGPLPRVRRSPSPRRVSTSSQSIDRNEDPMNESHIETFYNPKSNTTSQSSRRGESRTI